MSRGQVNQIETRPCNTNEIFYGYLEINPKHELPRSSVRNKTKRFNQITVECNQKLNVSSQGSI